jgi:hypothetical protein
MGYEGPEKQIFRKSGAESYDFALIYAEDEYIYRRGESKTTRETLKSAIRQDLETYPANYQTPIMERQYEHTYRMTMLCKPC